MRKENSLTPRPSLNGKREEKGLGDNPGRKCPEVQRNVGEHASNNDVTIRLLWFRTRTRVHTMYYDCLACREFSVTPADMK